MYVGNLRYKNKDMPVTPVLGIIPDYYPDGNIKSFTGRLVYVGLDEKDQLTTLDLTMTLVKYHTNGSYKTVHLDDSVFPYTIVLDYYKRTDNTLIGELTLRLPKDDGTHKEHHFTFKLRKQPSDAFMFDTIDDIKDVWLTTSK